MKAETVESQAVNGEQHQYLTFFLSGEEFGVGILQVKEILEYTAPTPVPMVPDFIKGVINLRGNVVPVVDLKAKFRMPRSEATRRSCVVIVEVDVDGEQTTMGIVVDAVSEVMEIAPQDIEPPPPFGARIKVDFIRGMAKLDKKFIILLDIDRVLSAEELAVVDRLRTESRDAAAGSGEAPAERPAGTEAVSA